jgi:hypothetical protein
MTSGLLWSTVKIIQMLIATKAKGHQSFRQKK